MGLKETILTRKQAAEDYLSKKRSLWDEYENMFHGYVGDDLSQTAKSQIFDPKLSTLLLDRSARVMSQLPVGKVKAISKNDEGASRVMNLMIDKYILPNANAQFDFLTKTRMIDLYSNLYGNYFGLIDWVVRDDGYVGPDMWLINIRDVFPQVGAISIEDSDYIIVRSWKPLSWFEGLGKNKTFKNISKVVNKLKDKSGDKSARGSVSKSTRENVDYSSDVPAKGKGYFEVLSMYEKDRWTDFVPSAEEFIRDSKNPHDNEELPVVNKYSIPLMDDFMGMGDFERGASMQYGINSLWNLYLDAVKVSIFPPVLLDADKIADASSIKWASAAKWLMKNGGAAVGARTLNLTPQGINTFSNTYQAMTASILNMFGTTDTSISEKVDPGLGKTPQALKMQAQRENARDNVDRFYMEQFLTKVIKKFVNMMSNKATGNVTFRMFEDEIKEIEKAYPDVKDMYDEKSGKISVDKSKFGSIIYDYEIVSGSTYAVDQKEQQKNLINLLTVLTENMQQGPEGVTSPMIESLRAEGKEVSIGELFTRILANSGIQDWDKIVFDNQEENQKPEEIQQVAEETMNQADQQLAQYVQEMMQK